MKQTPGSKALCILWDSKYIFYIRKTPQPADNHGFSLYLSPLGDEKYKPIVWIGCGDKGSEMFMGNQVSMPNGKTCTISFTYKIADGAEILIDGKENVKAASKLKQPLSPAIFRTAIGDRYSGSFFPFQGDILDIKLLPFPQLRTANKTFPVKQEIYHVSLEKSLSFLLLFCSVIWVHAITPFKDGDKVIFLGDSITHGGDFLYWVQAMYQLRQPGKIRVENAGISGDVASGGLARLGNDVLDKKPNRVFIMFGMNDINLSLYSRGGTDLDEKRMKPLKNYEKNLNQLCDRLKDAGVSVTLITPTPYNQYGKGNPSTYNPVS